MILGIDPGTAIVGYSFVSGTKQKPVIHEYGVITTPKMDKEMLPTRLLEISRDLEELLKVTRPEKAVVEDLFFAKNVKTAISVAHARGVILMKLAEYGIPVESPTPLQIKQTVCGYGNATKKQVQNMVVRIFNLDSIPQPDDAADSLAIAWWGLQ
jgi:crossover junction endodeoxyribonuclease RuvC